MLARTVADSASSSSSERTPGASACLCLCLCVCLGLGAGLGFALVALGLALGVVGGGVNRRRDDADDEAVGEGGRIERPLASAIGSDLGGESRNGRSVSG